MTAAEAFRQWSPSSVAATVATEPFSQFEQRVKAHQATADGEDQKRPNAQIAQEKAVQETAVQEKVEHDLARQQATAVSETVHPSGAFQAKPAIDTAAQAISGKASSEKVAAAVRFATDPLLNGAVSPSTNGAAGLTLHNPPREGQGETANGGSSAQTSTTRALPSVAAIAAVATVGTVRKANTVWTPGWWIWPLVALLLGIGLGALMLYVYAANMVR
jgi:hypothetical protein